MLVQPAVKRGITIYFYHLILHLTFFLWIGYSTNISLFFKDSSPASNNITALLHYGTTTTIPLYQKDEKVLLIPRQIRGQQQQQQFQSYPLYPGFGSYFVEVYVGKPTPQRQTLVVDTGSYITTFPCSGCTIECDPFHDHLDPSFAPNASITYESATCPKGCTWASCDYYDTHRTGETRVDGLCTISNYYSEGMVSTLVEGKDWVHLSIPLITNSSTDGTKLNYNGSQTPTIANYNDSSQHQEQQIILEAPIFKLVFACMTGATFSKGNVERHMADGIMAMGARSKYSFMDQMYRENMVAQNQFSLCLGKKVIAKGNDAGVLTIGGLDARLHQTPMVFARETGTRNLYEVYVKNIYLRTSSGGISITKVDLDPINFNARGVALKSGIPYTYLSSSISKAFRRAWREAIGEEYTKTPLKLSPSQLDALPTILFQFQGLSSIDYTYNLEANNISGVAGNLDPTSPYDVIVAMPPAQYMEYDETKASYTSRLYLDVPEGSVLGENFMQRHDVFFDLDRHLVGFAESDCIFSSLLGKVPVVNEMSFFGLVESHNNYKIAMEQVETNTSQSVSAVSHRIVYVLLAVGFLTFTAMIASKIIC